MFFGSRKEHAMLTTDTTQHLVEVEMAVEKSPKKKRRKKPWQKFVKQATSDRKIFSKREHKKKRAWLYNEMARTTYERTFRRLRVETAIWAFQVGVPQKVLLAGVLAATCRGKKQTRRTRELVQLLESCSKPLAINSALRRATNKILVGALKKLQSEYKKGRKKLLKELKSAP